MRRMSSVSRLKSFAGSATFTEADKEILIKIVKHAQWQGVSGTKGPWKNFLATVDRGLSHNHDPAKRPWQVLANFVETWKDEKDIEIIKRAREYINYNQTMAYIEATEPWPDVPEEGWVRSDIVKAEDLSSSPKLLAMDCEMVLCDDGTSQVVRVCVVDRDLETIIDTLVQPSKKVKEYKSHITGVTADDLKSVTVTQSDIQTQVKRKLSPGSIVIGHSVHNDLRALHIDHRRVIDTAYLFPIQNRARIWSPPLRELCKIVLGYDFRDDSKPHDCLEDAKIPMKLVLNCIEHGLSPISIPDEVDEAVLSKLLIHRVPKEVNYESLKLIFPRRISFEFQEIEKDGMNGNGTSKSRFYSTYAVFASKEVANKVFDQLKGVAVEDITGRLMKNVAVRSRFQHRNATRIEVAVRKMSNNRNNVEKPLNGSTTNVATKWYTVPETVKPLDVGLSSGVGEEVLSLTRPRIEDVEEHNVTSAAKNLKRKKRKSHASTSTSGEDESKEVAEEVDTVVHKNVYDVLSSEISPIAHQNDEHTRRKKRKMSKSTK
ncbi:hypothetical protein AXG93_4368s1880 [Marchantia polymorpha subsp. ruderalis]|uniref:Exonuclease domain-containing protein n=1 Tax=Marchantia polymorpha subsp. ruderalis TaxID=1480154 RepID=A0A176VY45_MARPO|nr:hypothetical protein AXG93_4368s1880 [Marchantia polymorpha subsp. ruderalis]